MGVLGATNCAIRREIFLRHNFDERFECGGEDEEMGKWILEHNYKIICDWKFAVYHSHGLKFKDLKKQIHYWSQLKNPTKFSRDKLHFRKDLNFNELLL
jgi:hypothetical protein